MKYLIIKRFGCIINDKVSHVKPGQKVDPETIKDFHFLNNKYKFAICQN